MPEIDPKHALRVYVEFLEIPEDQCPPNYYTLLAVSKTNQDNTSIDEAAKRRSNELRRGLPSELHLAGRKILKRIARARICLLDVDAKAAYDASIGLTTRVDRPSKVKPNPALHTKSAKAGHLTPPEVSSRSNNGPNRGATSVPPSLTSQATSHRRILPSQKPSAKTSPPEIDEFDDLMASLPDIESTLAPLPVVKVKPGFSEEGGPAQSRTVLYAVASSTLVAVIVYFLMPSAPPNIAESAPLEKIVPLVVDDSEEPPELPETEAEQTQPVIPELPLAERIKGDTSNAEFSISGGILAVSLSTPIPYENPVLAYVAGTKPSGDDTILLTFNGETSDEGYFNIDGRQVVPRVYVDDPSIMQWKPVATSILNEQDHSYTNSHKCVFLAPGEATLIIHFDGQEIRIPFFVTKLALPLGFGEKELIDLLGVPGDKEIGTLSWPSKNRIIDGETYEPSSDFRTVNWNHWYYNEYSTVAFVPNRSKIRHIFPKQELVVDSPPKTETTTPIRSAPKHTEPLPKEITLPQLRNSDSALSSKEGVPVDLGEIDDSRLDKLRLSLDQPVVEGDAIARFDMVRLADAEEQPVWEIRLRSAPKEETDEKSALDDVGAGLDELVGKIYVEESLLKFMWATPEHMSLAEQLRNCVLCFENAPQSHRMAFRKCTLVKPILIDFTNASHVIKLEQESLPPRDALVLEITSLENFSVSYEQHPVDGIISFGDTLRIILLDWAKPAELRVKFGGSRKNPSAIISAYYNLEAITRDGKTRGGKWRRMTIKQLDGGIAGAERALFRSRGDLQAGQAARGRLPSQIDSLGRELNSSNNESYARIQGQLLTAKRQLAKANGMVRRASRLIPELEAKMPLLKQLTVVGNRLHQKARIQLRIYVRMEKENMDLLRTSSDAIEGKVEDALR